MCLEEATCAASTRSLVETSSVPSKTGPRKYMIRYDIPPPTQRPSVRFSFGGLAGVRRKRTRQVERRSGLPQEGGDELDGGLRVLLHDPVTRAWDHATGDILCSGLHHLAICVPKLFSPPSPRTGILSLPMRSRPRAVMGHLRTNRTVLAALFQCPQ